MDAFEDHPEMQRCVRTWAKMLFNFQWCFEPLVSLSSLANTAVNIPSKMMHTASKRRKRMVLLDEAYADVGYDEEDVEDEEDARTK